MNENPEAQHEEHHRLPYYRLLNGMNTSDDGDNNWLISMSDVLSLLLVFFIMFLVLSKASGEPEKTTPPSEVQLQEPPKVELRETGSIVGDRIRDEISSGINDLELGDDIAVLSTNKEIIITVKERITFRPGEADILNSFEPVLDNIAGIIGRYPHLSAEIIGHTDSTPINTYRYPSNWELSVARATGVLKYLINKHSLDPSRLSVKGNADMKPVAPNDSPANRAQNRRVVILVYE